MMKVLLLMSLFGLSFSVLAKGFSGCDLEVPEEFKEKLFVKNVNCRCGSTAALDEAKYKALLACRKAGYSNCRVIDSLSDWDEKTFMIWGYNRYYASVTVAGEKRKKRSYNNYKTSLCSKINECILNADEEVSEKGLDRLTRLFEMNKC